MSQSSPTAIPVSAPPRVAAHVRSAPDGPLEILHRTHSAVYVDVAGRCVGIVAPGAAQVPCALRLPDSSSQTPSGVSATTVLAAEPLSPYVVRGTLHLSGNPLRIGRFVDVRVPRIVLSGVLGRAASPAQAVARPPRPAAVGLAAHSAARSGALADLPPLPPAIDRTIVARLVGNGGGLTPLGDDVLCGWLAVLAGAGRLTDEVAAAVRSAMGRTTSLSATLLDCALHGEVLPELATYLSALGTPSEDAATEALTRIGHTSGAGLWWGARHALTVLAQQEAA